VSADVTVPAPRAAGSDDRPDIALYAPCRLFLDGIASLIGRISAGHVVAAGTELDAVLALSAALPQPPRVLVVHAAQLDGVTTLEAVRRVVPATGVVAVGLEHGSPATLGWAQAGALGLLDETADGRELSAAIRLVARRQAWCSPGVTTSLLNHVTADRAEPRLTGRDLLTQRELEVALLMSRGLTNKEIGRRLNIQVATVKNHVHNILTKLDVPTRAQARI
jgi:DNA-binding NarL/FixJ family response regulator